MSKNKASIPEKMFQELLKKIKEGYFRLTPEDHEVLEKIAKKL